MLVGKLRRFYEKKALSLAVFVIHCHTVSLRMKSFLAFPSRTGESKICDDAMINLQELATGSTHKKSSGKTFVTLLSD